MSGYDLIRKQFAVLPDLPAVHRKTVARVLLVEAEDLVVRHQEKERDRNVGVAPVIPGRPRKGGDDRALLISRELALPDVVEIVIGLAAAAHRERAEKNREDPDRRDDRLPFVVIPEVVEPAPRFPVTHVQLSALQFIPFGTLVLIHCALLFSFPASIAQIGEKIKTGINRAAGQALPTPPHGGGPDAA